MSAAQVQFANSAVGFTLSGVVGENGGVANGVFTKSALTVHGKPVYQKLEAPQAFCYYSKRYSKQLCRTLPTANVLEDTVGLLRPLKTCNGGDEAAYQ